MSEARPTVRELVIVGEVRRFDSGTAEFEAS